MNLYQKESGVQLARLYCLAIYARFGQHASQILQFSGSQYATLKVRVKGFSQRVPPKEYISN